MLELMIGEGREQTEQDWKKGIREQMLEKKQAGAR